MKAIKLIPPNKHVQSKSPHIRLIDKNEVRRTKSLESVPSGQLVQPSVPLTILFEEVPKIRFNPRTLPPQQMCLQQAQYGQQLKNQAQCQHDQSRFTTSHQQYTQNGQQQPIKPALVQQQQLVQPTPVLQCQPQQLMQEKVTINRESEVFPATCLSCNQECTKEIQIACTKCSSQCHLRCLQKMVQSRPPKLICRCKNRITMKKLEQILGSQCVYGLLEYQVLGLQQIFKFNLCPGKSCNCPYIFDPKEEKTHHCPKCTRKQTQIP